MTTATIDEAGCLAVAIEHYGVPVHHVRRSGLVMEKTSYGYNFYLGDQRALKAFPLALRLHTALTGNQSEYVKEAFKVAARRCDIDWPTIMEMLDTFDAGDVDRALVEEAHRYSRKHARRHRIENQWFAAVQANPARLSMRHA